MGKFKLCFVFDEAGNYQAVPYSKLVDGNTRRSEYEHRYFIPLDSYLLEVSREDYHEHYKAENRQDYLRREAQRVGEVSLEDEASYDTLAIRALYVDIAEEAISNTMIEQLHKAIAKLDDDERRLIHFLYFEGLTERRCAEVFGVYRNAIHMRKKRALEKLRKYLL